MSNKNEEPPHVLRGRHTFLCGSAAAATIHEIGHGHGSPDDAEAGCCHHPVEGDVAEVEQQRRHHHDERNAVVQPVEDRSRQHGVAPYAVFPEVVQVDSHEGAAHEGVGDDHPKDVDERRLVDECECHAAAQPLPFTPVFRTLAKRLLLTGGCPVKEPGHVRRETDTLYLATQPVVHDEQQGQDGPRTPPERIRQFIGQRDRRQQGPLQEVPLQRDQAEHDCHHRDGGRVVPESEPAIQPVKAVEYLILGRFRRDASADAPTECTLGPHEALQGIVVGRHRAFERVQQECRVSLVDSREGLEEERGTELVALCVEPTVVENVARLPVFVQVVQVEALCVDCAVQLGSEHDDDVRPVGLFAVVDGDSSQPQGGLKGLSHGSPCSRRCRTSKLYYIFID